MWKRLGDVWCSLMHEQPMWPIHGRYECRICGRQHQVAWAEPQSRPAWTISTAGGTSAGGGAGRSLPENQWRAIMWLANLLMLFVVLSLMLSMISDRPGARK